MKRKSKTAGFVVTEESREQVSLYIAGGLTYEHIARHLGTTVEALTAAFGEDLNEAAGYARMKMLDAAYDMAMGGNASTINRMVGHFDSVAERRAAPTEEKLNKTEQRKATAQESAKSGKFPVRTAPKLAVNNG